MTATTCFMEFIFFTEREKPINESDVDSDGEIDSESTEIRIGAPRRSRGNYKSGFF